MTLQALLWDVDGTIAETERDGHRVAFNRAFEAFGLPWRWDVGTYGGLLRVTGGRERLLHDFQTRPGAPADVAERERLAAALHARKNLFHAKIVAQGLLPARPGVLALMQQARETHEANEGAVVRQAIVTTTSRSNVAALMSRLLGTAWAEGFAAVICGEDVAAKKPSPEAHLRALAALRLAPAAGLAIEDSPPGVAAARAAGLSVLLTRSVYFPVAHPAAAMSCQDLTELCAEPGSVGLLTALRGVHRLARTAP